MSDFVCAESLDWSCVLNETSDPPAPWFSSPAEIWFGGNPFALEEEFAEPQIRPIADPPQLPEEHPPRIVGIIWDAGQVVATVHAIRISLDAQKGKDLLRRLRRGADSFSDSDASGPDDGRRTQQLRYPSVSELDAGDFRLLVPNSLVQLEEVLCRLPQAARQETLRNICLGFSDLIEDQWILRTYSAVADPCEDLVNVLLRKLKITTKLLRVMWQQLDEQNCQLCQELKQEYFAEVAGPCINNLLEVACSFSSARWTADHIVQMLPIFDILADALYNIRDISFIRSEFIDNKIADIFRNMVNAFRGALEETAYDMHRSKESTTHPATYFLIRVLEFFYCYREMVHPILAPEDCILVHHCWVSRLKEDAERIFPGEKDRQHIFILNNTCFVWQKKHDPRGFLSNEQVERFYSVIQQYIKCYLDEYWAPLLTYLEGNSLRRPCRSSLDKFTGEFDSKCDRQMKWKVRTELKKILRDKITSLIIRPYEQFLVALQATPSSTYFVVKRLILDLLFFGKKNGDIYTVEELESTLMALFER